MHTLHYILLKVLSEQQGTGLGGGTITNVKIKIYPPSKVYTLSQRLGCSSRVIRIDYDYASQSDILHVDH